MFCKVCNPAAATLAKQVWKRMTYSQQVCSILEKCRDRGVERQSLGLHDDKSRVSSSINQQHKGVLPGFTENAAIVGTELTGPT
jgi:hypothetical protein